MKIKWSEEITFEKKNVEQQVPNKLGIYQILQSKEYPRFNGFTRILYIGKSIGGLRQEIVNHFRRHAVSNRLKRIRNRTDRKVLIKFAIIDKDVNEIEKILLRNFEDKHWDLPVLNSQRGYAREEDKHYRKK